MSLVPNLDMYIQEQSDILLYGAHGTGKSAVLLDAAAKHNLTIKYFSCSTLDPFTDLVGIPYPENMPDGSKALKMIRPREIDQAQVIFFDELNRSQDSKTLNAVLEIVQFRSINGEPLPNLMSCWAAVNPPDDIYQVHDLDPALVDRFDVFHEIKPQVSVQYLEQFIDRQLAMALQNWWNDRQTNAQGKPADVTYVSPRRVEKIGRMVQNTQNANVARMMLPPGGNYDHGKLVTLLRDALQSSSSSPSSSIAAPADPSIDYTKAAFIANPCKVAACLQDPNVSQETINKAVGVLSSNVGVSQLVSVLGKIIEALPAHEIEGMINGWPPAKKSAFKREWDSEYATGGVTVSRPWEGASKAPLPQSSGQLAGKKFAVTGAFPGHTRNTIEPFLAKHGAIIHHGVTPDTDYLLVGVGSWNSSKQLTARQYGTQCMNLTDVEEAIINGVFNSTDIDSVVPTPK